MMSFLKRSWLVVTGVITGALAGWLYWKLVGCSSGSCEITSKPLNSAAYGALMFGLVFSIFDSRKRIRKEERGKN